MPAKIDIKLVFEALHDKMKETGKTQVRYRLSDFTRLVKGASIASSKNAIETLWFQLLDSEANVYNGPCENLAIIDLSSIDALLYPGVHTHSHTHTLSSRVGVKQ